jgi:ABC-type lipoprotein release transport system permease subunit
VVGIAIDNTIFLGGELAGKAFMSRETLDRLLDRSDRLSFFALGLESREPGIADEILADVEVKFASLRPVVQPIYAEVQAAEEGSRLLTVALAAMLIIVSLVGALGILNTLTLNVLERRREVAVIRAMGGTDQAIITTFLAEGAALGAAGWIMGVILGYPAGYVITNQLGRVLFSLNYRIRAEALALNLIFTLLLAIGASLAPAIAAAHMPTSAAIRYE